MFGIEEVVANVNKSRMNNKCFILYDWLADSATTTHVTNQQDAFITYFPTTGTTVAGVGNTKTLIKGWGTVLLESECEGSTFIFELRNVLHVPTNQNSLLSLG